MTISGYLAIPGIEGASASEMHENEIDVHSVSWHIGQDDARGTTTSRRSNVVWSTFDFTKFYDRSSPYLAEAVSLGKTFPEIVFVVSMSLADGPTDYLRIELRNASIDRYELLTGDNRLEEVINIKCEKIEIDFEDHDHTGQSLGHEVVMLSR